MENLCNQLQLPFPVKYLHQRAPMLTYSSPDPGGDQNPTLHTCAESARTVSCQKDAQSIWDIQWMTSSEDASLEDML